MSDGTLDGDAAARGTTADSPGWTRMHRVLHWGVALAVACQLGIALWLDALGDDHPDFRFAVGWHASVGAAIFLTMAVRLAWRLTHPVPRLPDTLTDPPLDTVEEEPPGFEGVFDDQND